MLRQDMHRADRFGSIAACLWIFNANFLENASTLETLLKKILSIPWQSWHRQQQQCWWTWEGNSWESTKG